MKARHITIVMAALCLSSCEKAAPEKHASPGTPYTLTKVQEDMVIGNNGFAFDLLEAVSEDGEFSGKDFMVSPLSVSILLGALDNGATGLTSEEILTAIGFEGCTVNDINEYCRAILQGCPGVDDLVKVKMANAVMVKDIINLKKGFSDALTTYYDAYVRSMKFDKAALDEINGWCKEQTEGLIPKILDNIPERALLIALNSIYFKGDWAEKFDKENTRKAVFTNIEGTTGNVSMMHIKDSFRYSSNDLWETVRLPYGNGSYSMYVLLPKEGYSISDVIGSLDSGSWTEEKKRMNEMMVDLKLPSFVTESNIDLRKIMKSLGMKKAFSPSEAEFDEMFEDISSETYLGLLKHVSKIIVNEEGTEAAAVTVGGMCGTSVLPRDVTFHADRPFIYLIQEQSSNAIFFIGVKVRS